MFSSSSSSSGGSSSSGHSSSAVHSQAFKILYVVSLFQTVLMTPFQKQMAAVVRFLFNNLNHN